MTQNEKLILNTIENGFNQLRKNQEKTVILDTINGFQIMMTRDIIGLFDSPDIIVLLCDRGYLQLSQIVPLIAEIVEPYE